ncbi:MAG: GerMN domain-containing protein [Bacillota bacterium]|nr:GerMN domain-containing protein [Bacillota bacterium]
MSRWQFWIAIFIALALAGWSVGVSTRLTRDLARVEKDLDRAFTDLAALSKRVSEMKAAVQPHPAAEVTVYYARTAQTDSYLVPVRATVPAGTDAMRGALELLAKGPAPETGLERLIPEGTRVLGVSTSGDLATADFSSEIRTRFPGGSRTEELLVWSIVNTLTEFPGIARVQILVDGKREESIGGHVGIDAPLERNPGLIRPQ